MNGIERTSVDLLDPFFVVFPIAQHFAPFEKPFGGSGLVRSQRPIGDLRTERLRQRIADVLLVSILHVRRRLQFVDNPSSSRTFTLCGILKNQQPGTFDTA